MLGALVGDFRGFYTVGDSYCFLHLLFLVSEDNYSFMGGSDVVNCGRYWALWAHSIGV